MEHRGGDAERLNDRVSILEWISAIRRRKFLFSLIGIALIGLSAFALSRVPSRYSAQSIVMIDPERGQTSDPGAVIPLTRIDLAAVRSEMEVIRSPAMVQRVVARLGLADDPRFADAQPGLLARAEDWISARLASLGLPIGSRPAPAPATGDSRVDNAIRVVDSHLAVMNDGHSYILRIAYEARDPALAAKIANTVADIYLRHQVELKTAMARNVDQWLTSQLADIRRMAQKSDQAVEAFRASHGLLEASRKPGQQSGQTILAQQIADLNSQVVAAATDRAQKEAAYAEIQKLEKGGAIDTGAAVLASPLIQKLQEQEAEVSRRLQDLKSEFLPGYPAIKAMQAQHKDIQRKIREEVDKVARGIQSDLAVARARETRLRTNLQTLREEAAKSGEAGVRLGSLEREAEANRDLLRQMLAKSKQIAAQKAFLLADARLVSKATPPAEPSFPRRRLLMALATLIALAIAAAIAVMVERARSGFRGEQELETEVGLPTLGIIPKIKGRLRSPALVAGGAESAYPESLAMVRSSLRGLARHPLPQLILVTSSVPGEGKTSFASSLACSLAASSLRCLLIDCDLRRPGVAGQFGVSLRDGEAAGAGAVPWESTVRHSASGLDLVLARCPAENPQAVIESLDFRRFLSEARQKYDLVILDAPPVFPVADAMLLAGLADATIFVIKWESTPRTVVQTALRSLRSAGGTIAGTVLTQVNLKRHALYRLGDHGDCVARYGARYYAKKS